MFGYIGMECSICFHYSDVNSMFPCQHRICIFCDKELRQRICPFCRAYLPPTACKVDPIDLLWKWFQVQAQFQNPTTTSYPALNEIQTRYVLEKRAGRTIVTNQYE